jgi:predicted DNA-binding transcriptional regulator AlpA
MGEVIALLHELIAVTRGKAHDAWIGINEVAEYLSMSRDHVEKHIVSQPDFPRPARPRGVGHPRWLRSDVSAWMRSQQ